MNDAAVYRDSLGEPWVEVAPGKVIALDLAVRLRLLEKFGAAELADAQAEFGLRLLSPQE
jgi:hypothetical protein